MNALSLLGSVFVAPSDHYLLLSSDTANPEAFTGNQPSVREMGPFLSPVSPHLGCGQEAREQGYEEKQKSAPTAADIMASKLRCSWTPKQ